MAETGLARLLALSTLISDYLSVVKYYFKNSDKNFGHCVSCHSNCIYLEHDANTSKVGRRVGCHSRELVFVVTWRHYWGLSASPIPQRGAKSFHEKAG
jgi:hypothetical protein